MIFENLLKSPLSGCKQKMFVPLDISLRQRMGLNEETCIYFALSQMNEAICSRVLLPERMET